MGLSNPSTARYLSSLSGWIPVQGHTNIRDYNLEKHPIEIKTNSSTDNDDCDYMEIGFFHFNLFPNYIGNFIVSFGKDGMKYAVDRCKHWLDFPLSLPTEIDKIWRITVTKDTGVRFQVHCNDVEIINFLFSDESCSDERGWNKYWSMDINTVGFINQDNASNFYRSTQRPGDFFNIRIRALSIIECHIL